MFLSLSGLGAVLKYDDDFNFVNLWSEIEIEIRDVVLRLRASGDSQREYVSTIKVQCQKIAKALESVIAQLHEETIDHEQGDIIFRRVLYLFEEELKAFNVIVLLNDTEIYETKNKIIYNLETIIEHMEQLVYIGKIYCPQLRALLRTLLVDFLKFARGFRTDAAILEKNIIIYESPRHMVTQIHKLTKQFTDILKECNHMEELRVILRGYIRYVEEIIHKLEEETFDDAVMNRLINELRQMFIPLMKMIMREEHLDVEEFKKNLILHFFRLNEVFEQLVELITNHTQSTEMNDFIEKIIYFYYYAIKQTHFETRTTYKNSFYGSEYHNEFFVGNDLQTPNYSSHDEEEPKGEYAQQWGELKYGHDSNGYDIESPKELVLRNQKLVQEIFERLQTEEASTASYLRELVKVVDYIIDKISKEITIDRLAYTKSTANKLYTNLKEIKGQIDRILGNEDINKFAFARLVQNVSNELYRVVIVEKTQDNGYEHLLYKDICKEFYTFLRNILYQIDVYEEYHPTQHTEKCPKNNKEHKFVLIKIIKY
ncbi:hypothetical protein FQA39_LY18114 [Lamprigera yunnana]|nr:hypothetical protein FQA39_LY18114 [Lamprigera yunnana]